MSKTRIAAIFAAALVSVFGAAACGGGEEVAQQAEQLEQLEQRVERLERQLDRQQKILNQQVRETVKEETQP